MNKHLLFIAITLFSLVLIAGCNKSPAISSVLEGAIKFNGTLPAESQVPFQTNDGKTITVESAYSGFIYLFADMDEKDEVVKQAILENGGTIAASIPKAGLYMIQVAAGTESAFIKTMSQQNWFLDAYPAFSVNPAKVVVTDFFSQANPPSDCSKDHGQLTTRVATAQSIDTYTVDINQDLPSKSMLSIINKMGETMENLESSTDRTVFSFSLQSKASYDGVSGEELLTGCHTIRCQTVRDEQKVFFRMFLQAMEAEIKLNPRAADRAMIVVAAGNAGVDLGIEIEDLKKAYPNAFSRVKLVGASDSNGEVARSMNHIADGEPEEMVYSLGYDKPIRSGMGQQITCSGTSFSTPEVAGVLDKIWAENPSLTSAQVMKILDQTISEMGRNRVIPNNKDDGRTTKAFIDRAIQLAKGQATAVAPAANKNQGSAKALDFELPAELNTTAIGNWFYFDVCAMPETDENGIAVKCDPSGCIDDRGNSYICTKADLQRERERWGGGGPEIRLPEGGTPPYYFTASGLPEGIEMQPGGNIASQIADSARVGDYDIQVCVRDSKGATVCKNTKLNIVKMGVTVDSVSCTLNSIVEKKSDPSLDTVSYDLTASGTLVSDPTPGSYDEMSVTINPIFLEGSQSLICDGWGSRMTEYDFQQYCIRNADSPSQTKWKLIQHFQSTRTAGGVTGNKDSKFVMTLWRFNSAGSTVTLDCR